MIVGGDLNEDSGRGGLAHARRRAGRRGACRPTARTGSRSPCANPRERIDALFVDPRITVTDYDVIDTPETRRASDHFPIMADLELTRPRGRNIPFVGN